MREREHERGVVVVGVDRPLASVVSVQCVSVAGWLRLQIIRWEVSALPPLRRQVRRAPPCCANPSLCAHSRPAPRCARTFYLNVCIMWSFESNNTAVFSPDVVYTFDDVQKSCGHRRESNCVVGGMGKFERREPAPHHTSRTHIRCAPRCSTHYAPCRGLPRAASGPLAHQARSESQPSCGVRGCIRRRSGTPYRSREWCIPSCPVCTPRNVTGDSVAPASGATGAGGLRGVRRTNNNYTECVPDRAETGCSRP